MKNISGKLALLVGLLLLAQPVFARQTGNNATPAPSTKAEILSIGKVQYTEEARREGIEGIVILNVNLAADGQVTDIRVVKGLPKGLTEKAIEVAQQIRFRPATKDGQPVNTRVSLEFQFQFGPSAPMAEGKDFSSFSITFYRAELQKFRKNNDQKNLAQTLLNLGALYRRFGQYGQALVSYEEALALWQKEKAPKKEGIVWLNLGGAYREMGKIEIALQHLERALTIFKTTKEPESEADTLGLFALTYSDLFLYEKALEYHNQARLIWQRLKKPRGERDVLVNMSTVYFDLNRSDKAQEYLEQAIALSRKMKWARALRWSTWARSIRTQAVWTRRCKRSSRR